MMLNFQPVKINYQSKYIPSKQYRSNLQSEHFVSFGKEAPPKPLSKKEIKEKYIIPFENAVNDPSSGETSYSFIDVKTIIKDMEKAHPETQNIFLSFIDKEKEDPSLFVPGFTMFTYALFKYKDKIAEKLLDFAESLDNNPDAQRAFISASYYKTLDKVPKPLPYPETKIIKRFLEFTARVAPDVIADSSVYWEWKKNDIFRENVKNAFNNTEKLSQQQARRMVERYPDILKGYDDNYISENYKDIPEQKSGGIRSAVSNLKSKFWKK